MKVHILVRQGPEWFDIVGVFADRSAAQQHADDRNRKKDNSGDSLESMSSYVVVTKAVK